MRSRFSLAFVAFLAVLSLPRPALPQAADPVPPKKAAADLLARETEQLLDERNLRPAVYNGVKFLALIAQGKINQADGVFLTRPARQLLQEGHVLDTIRQLDFKPPFSIQCVGFNSMSLDALTLVYIGTTEQGPIGVKLYIYKHESNVYVGRVDVADDWTELERMTQTDSVVRLPAPLVINVTAPKNGNDAGDVAEGAGK